MGVRAKARECSRGLGTARVVATMEVAGSAATAAPTVGQR